MKKLPLLFAALTAASLALAMFLPFPHRTDNLYVPTIYPPGGSFAMPIKLDDHQSINGLSSLENATVRAEGKSLDGKPLKSEPLTIESKRHQQTWGRIRVKIGDSKTRMMNYACIEIKLPEGDDWRGAQITLTANATLLYPVESMSGYIDKQEPITRDYALKIATREEEQDAKSKQAHYDAATQEWNVRWETWRKTRKYALTAAGIFVLACIVTFIMKSRASGSPS